jgi:DNA-3-methyladenine glycosylase II
VVAARAIFGRLIDRFGGCVPTPSELATVSAGELREIGLSGQKALTLLELAHRFSEGQLSESELEALSDEEAIARLSEIKGVGPWTAKGALLIAFQRPNLVRGDDLALRRSIERHYGLDHLPSPNEVSALAERWAPYRSLASSLLLSAGQRR